MNHQGHEGSRRLFVRFRTHWRLAVFVAVGVGLCLSVAAQRKNMPATPAKPGNEDAQVYRNATFGFRFQIPYGWVDRAKEMREGDEVGKAEVLLAVFERPPEARGETINAAVVIAAESAAAYPGVKRAEDYAGPLTDLATAKGFKADGEPYALEVESRHLLRADFVKTIGDKLVMHQSTLVLLAKGQIVSFTFIGGSDEELDEVMDGLHFGVEKTAP
jgi:hypothetical protein